MGEAAFQSNFKFEVGDTLFFFYLCAININVTLQNSRPFTYGIISSKDRCSKLQF